MSWVKMLRLLASGTADQRPLEGLRLAAVRRRSRQGIHIAVSIKRIITKGHRPHLKNHFYFSCQF